MYTKLLFTAAMLTLSLQMLGCGQPKVSFAADVQPILQTHCLVCHDSIGEGVAASGFSVRDYDSVMKGTIFGPVVIPNSSMSSTLYLVIANKTAPEIQMPPQHPQALAKGRGLPLSDEEIETIAVWIDQGALNN